MKLNMYIIFAVLPLGIAHCSRARVLIHSRHSPQFARLFTAKSVNTLTNNGGGGISCAGVCVGSRARNVYHFMLSVVCEFFCLP